MIGTSGPRKLTFSGDLTATAVGQIVGPNTLHEWLCAYGAEYDSVSDTTTVFYRYATLTDIDEGLPMPYPRALTGPP